MQYLIISLALLGLVSLCLGVDSSSVPEAGSEKETKETIDVSGCNFKVRVNEQTSGEYDVGIHHTNAYVAIFYEGTPRDYEYYLGARVMFHSLRLQKLQADFVVLISPNVQAKYRQEFHKDGIRVIEVENVLNPYVDVKPRFRYALNKFHAWTLHQYKRIIYLDADNMATGNLDVLFSCGHFCVVYQNPCNFHTGLIVLKPSLETFDNFVEKLNSGLHSYDGADQGFLISYYKNMIYAPLFDLQYDPITHLPIQSEKPLERLQSGYNFNAYYYYGTFSFGVYPKCCPILSVGYPFPPVMKPWVWYTSPICTLHTRYKEVRDSMRPDFYEYYTYEKIGVCLLFSLPFVVWFMKMSVPDTGNDTQAEKRKVPRFLLALKGVHFLSETAIKCIGTAVAYFGIYAAGKISFTYLIEAHSRYQESWLAFWVYLNVGVCLPLGFYLICIQYLPLPSKRKSSKEGDSEDEEEEETEEHRSDRSKVLKSWLFYNGLLHLAYWTSLLDNGLRRLPFFRPQRGGCFFVGDGPCYCLGPLRLQPNETLYGQKDCLTADRRPLRPDEGTR